MAGTLVNRGYQFQSGTGSNAWVFTVLVDGSDNYYCRIDNAPSGLSNYDSLNIPESVVDDMKEAIDLVKSVSGSSGTSGFILL